MAATRGRETNQLYVDTRYDPDPQTSHGDDPSPRPPEKSWRGSFATKAPIRRPRNDPPRSSTKPRAWSDSRPNT